VKAYYSKLLLFGEYTIILGGQALALPLDRFSCRWTTEGEGAQSRTGLSKFFAYLRQLESRNWLHGALDLRRMEQDLRDGFFLQSNIPVGYGLGSSGALCAAVYDRYGLEKIDRMETARYPELRYLLGLMESHFHGASSGVDPLICYLNQPVLIKTGAEIERVSATLPTREAGMQFFLLDTQMPRQTGPLVERFLQKCEDPAYALRVENELIPETEAAIGAFLSGKWPELPDRLHAISLFQWEHFREMIPGDFHAVWQAGLERDLFKLKLCGAGGGGFLLGWTRDASLMTEELGAGFELTWL
jgi:mevalonate kinase